jgi:hypothetical protein
VLLRARHLPAIACGGLGLSLYNHRTWDSLPFFASQLMRSMFRII